MSLIVNQIPLSVLGVSSQRLRLEACWAGVSLPGVAWPGVMCPGVASHTRADGVAPGVSPPRPGALGVSSQAPLYNK